MSRENDAKISRWSGLARISLLTDRIDMASVAFYTTRDSDAVCLLPVLVKKDFFPLLEHKYDDRWHLELWERIEVSPKHYESGLAFSGAGATIHEAISEAVLKIIRECAE